jgi:cardiolipin synthase
LSRDAVTACEGSLAAAVATVYPHSRSMTDLLIEFWRLLVGALTILLSVIASAHAIRHKRDARAAVSWVGLIWLVPIFGPVFYGLLGINRIRRRATELQRESLDLALTTGERPQGHDELKETLPEGTAHLTAIAQLVDRVTEVPLTKGNRLTPLVNGDTAFPAMIEAIESAQHSVALSTYIFDNDIVGQRFANALERAVRRRVEVRVLIDGLGSHYSFPSMVRVLRERGLRVSRFLHSFFPWRMPYMNLRNHRKILVADGLVGFTGGMNIRTDHMLSEQPRAPVQDVHFRIEGPVVSHLAHAFAEDWAFSTGEILLGGQWFPSIGEIGSVAARGISDGPDQDLEKIQWTMLGALARAERRVQIVTPYFLPNQAMITSLNVAAMRGVQVDIVLPEKSNLPFVRWASTAQLWQMLQRGCRVFLTPPPFDHSKLMIVDGAWGLVGSANWDPRSLRLNFEFCVECYDAGFARSLEQLVEEKLGRAQRLAKADVDARSLPVQLRDGVARLFAPYL